MTKLLSILTLGILLINTNPITELNVNNPPTKEEAKKLNRSHNEYEIFLNDKGDVAYRNYDYRNIKGTQLPFKIAPKHGRQVNLKIKNGWLVGFDKGEFGGGLYWFNDKGTEHKRITSGNIKNLFEINGEIYVTEGLAHITISRGQIFKVKEENNKWKVEKKIDLPNAPYSTTLTKDNEFLIVTSKGLLKVNKDFEIETLVEEGFWRYYLYPNSILIKGQDIYIGMRGGILRTKMDEIENQEWLTK